MKQKIWDVLKDTPLVLSGDGRNDSPGHSAKYSVYTIMEHFLDVITDVDCGCTEVWRSVIYNGETGLT